MIAAVSTALTFVVAVVAAVYARRQVTLARQTRDDQTRPYIVVDVETSPASYIHMDMVIRNVGATAARNVRLSFTPELKSTRYDDILDWAVFKDGVSTMPPGREIRMLFDSGPDRLEAALSNQYDVVVRYDDLRGHEQPPLKFVLDIASLYGIHRLGVKNVHHAAKALEDIKKILTQSTDRGRLAVGVTDLDVRNERERSERTITGRWPAASARVPHEALVEFGASPYRRWILRVVLTVWRKLKTWWPPSP